MVDRLAQKHKASAKFVPAPIIEKRAGAKFGVLTLGGCEGAVREALDLLDDRGIPADYMRVRGFPFSDEVVQFLEDHPYTFVVEQNRDAQLCSLLTIETPIAKDKLRSVLVYGGFPLSARHVIEGILSQIS